MISKKIHYCWFGRQPLPDDVQAMIATWRRYCPDYKIIEWNESNFDINANDYVREAYEAQKWAFVTDYVRLKVLYEQGGFYMDTDVEVVKPLDPLLVFDAVFGYETKTSIQTCTIGANCGNKWIETLLKNYDNRHFLKPDGLYDLTTNVMTITRLTTDRYRLILDGTTKKFGENMLLLPFDYLCAKSYQTGKVMLTKHTYTIHHFKGSWLTDEKKHQVEVSRAYYNKLSWIPFKCLRQKIAATISVYNVYGIIEVVKRIRKVIE